MISRIDHVSIAVKDYDGALRFFQDLLGVIPGVGAHDENMKYFWQIFSLGDLSRLELMTPGGEGSFLDNFLKEREGGVHHITLETPDIRKAKEALEKKGIPCFGFQEYGDFWKELFIHPRDAFGVLIQIAEFRPDDWISETLRFEEGVRWSVSRVDTGCTLSLAHPGGGKVHVNLSPEEAKRLAEELTESKE